MRNLDRLFVCGVVLTLCAELINNGYTSLLHCPAVEVIFSLGSSEISLKYTFQKLREPLSILIKYKTIDTPKIESILKKFISTFRLNYSYHQKRNSNEMK